MWGGFSNQFGHPPGIENMDEETKKKLQEDMEGLIRKHFGNLEDMETPEDVNKVFLYVYHALVYATKRDFYQEPLQPPKVAIVNFVK